MLIHLHSQATTTPKLSGGDLVFCASGQRFPVPWEPFGAAGCDVVVDAGQNVGETGLRIEAVQRGAFDQGHGLGEGFTARVVARKKPVLSASSDQPQGPFGWIIVDGHATIRQEQAERWPAVQSIAKRLGEVAFAQNVAQLLVRPNAEGLCPWA